MKKIPLIFIIAGFVMLGAKTPKEDDSTSDSERRKKPAIKINDEVINIGYFEDSLQRQSPLIRKKFLDDKEKDSVISKIIDMELLADEAKKRGFDKHQEIIAMKKNRLATFMHRKLAGDYEESDLSESALKEYYDSHFETYNKKEKIRASHILISDKKKAEELLAKMQNEKFGRRKFRQIAGKESEDNHTRLRGGDLSYLSLPEKGDDRTNNIDPAIVKAAFAIEKNGQLFPRLVITSRGYHIVMRTGHRKKLEMPFEKAKNRIAMIVKRENKKNHIKKKIELLKQSIPVEVFEENLGLVVIDLSGSPHRTKNK